MPTVSFFLATTDHPVDENHPLWRCPLPVNRQAGEKGITTVDSETITYGQYFAAVAQFCMADNWYRITKAASHQLEIAVNEKDLQHLSLYLEKHGAFYHPARLQLEVKKQVLYFAVNVAVSDLGKKAMPKEVKALENLNEHRPFGWIPFIYDAQFNEMPMFLAGWFDGFHEFHLTRKKEHVEPVIAVWDGADELHLLSQKQAADLYHDASMILSACYDPLTAHQIFPWHHAAGDFVVQANGGDTKIRLITVRNYATMTGTGTEPADETEMLDALLVFFLHLSIRMRIDRIDGVSEVVWAPDHCQRPIIDGFFHGLDLTARLSGFPENFPKIFRHFFGYHKEDDFLKMATGMIGTVYDRQSEEFQIIEKNLEHHIHQMIPLVLTG